MSTFRQIVEYDEVLGHKYVPLQKACLRYGQGTYILETDEHGFRNSLGKNGGKKRILILGDSFAAGDGVRNEDRFGDYLAQHFDCEVYNLACSGYGADQQLLAYQRLKAEIPHDVVIFCPHLDDLQRAFHPNRMGISKSTGDAISIPKPAYKLEKGQLVLTNVPVPNSREKWEAEGKKNLVERGWNALVSRLVPQGEKDWEVLDVLRDKSGSKYELCKALLQAVQKETEGKELWVMPLPYNDMLQRENHPPYLSLFEEVFGAEKILDAAPLLKKDYDRNFLPICGHFSPYGHKQIGDMLGSRLSEKNGLTLRPLKPETEAVNYVLGISCYYHDSAAAILRDGAIVAAAQEERFSRVKHDKGFPANAINYCLEECGIALSQVNAVVYYDFDTWSIERTLWNALELAENGNEFWQKIYPGLAPKLTLKDTLKNRYGYTGSVFKCQHHISHAAGAFYPSGFSDAAILVIDGVGEWATTTIAKGADNRIEILKQVNYPDSIGLLYSAFTYFTGFKVNSGEYKLMGLAPYGNPIFADTIKKHLLDIKEDGSVKLNMDYFSFQDGQVMTSAKFAGLFNGDAREPESRITRREMDLAASIQAVTEEIVIKIANHAREITGSDYLVMTGGVALNCVANGKLFDESAFKDFYFQPASGDAGGALGAALMVYKEHFEKGAPKKLSISACLGPEFSQRELQSFLINKQLPHTQLEKDGRAAHVAKLLAENSIIGMFDGRMEFGPRALGNRSILGNPLSPDMQSKLNLKIKYRESFRPFAPIYLEERTSDYFDFDRPSPYMLVVRNLKEELLRDTEEKDYDDLIGVINQVRSDIPAITHVDNSARLQSVNKDENPRMHEILSQFEHFTGKGVLINTSFNVRGEPIVCTPEDAYKCFMRTEMDYLILGDFCLSKNEQPEFNEDKDWKEIYALD